MPSTFRLKLWGVLKFGTSMPNGDGLLCRKTGSNLRQCTIFFVLGTSTKGVKSGLSPLFASSPQTTATTHRFRLNRTRELRPVFSSLSFTMFKRPLLRDLSFVASQTHSINSSMRLEHSGDHQQDFEEKIRDVDDEERAMPKRSPAVESKGSRDSIPTEWIHDAHAYVVRTRIVSGRSI